MGDLTYGLFDTLDYLKRLALDFYRDPRYRVAGEHFIPHIQRHEEALTGACCLWPRRAEGDAPTTREGGE